MTGRTTTGTVASPALTAFFVLGDPDQALDLLAEACVAERAPQTVFELMEAAARTMNLTSFWAGASGQPADLEDTVEELVACGFLPQENREVVRILLLLAAAQAGGLRARTSEWISQYVPDPEDQVGVAWVTVCCAIRLVASRTGVSDEDIVTRYLSA